MGNRAVITASKSNDVATSNDIGVYVHWDGDYAIVEAILTYCKLKGYRTPESDNYGYARLCQVICNYFGGSLSVGIDKCCHLDCDNWDNGVYIIKDWSIVDRQYAHYDEDDEDEERLQCGDLTSIIIEIDKCMPVREQLGAEYIRNHAEVTVDPMPLW